MRLHLPYCDSKITWNILLDSRGARRNMSEMGKLWIKWPEAHHPWQPALVPVLSRKFSSPFSRAYKKQEKRRSPRKQIRLLLPLQGRYVQWRHPHMDRSGKAPLLSPSSWNVELSHHLASIQQQKRIERICQPAVLCFRGLRNWCEDGDCEDTEGSIGGVESICSGIVGGGGGGGIGFDEIDGITEGPQCMSFQNHYVLERGNSPQRVSWDFKFSVITSVNLTTPKFHLLAKQRFAWGEDIILEFSLLWYDPWFSFQLGCRIMCS